MRSDEYTPDAICQAMGLPSFIEGRWTGAPHFWLRVLLLPSFHPEVCLTLTDAPGEPGLSVIALASSLWTGGGAGVQPLDLETSGLAAEVLASAGGLSDDLVLRLGTESSGIAIDGLSAAIASMRQGRLLQVQIHSSSGAARASLAPLLRDAWLRLSSPHVRNAVSRCGSYLGATLPEDAEPARPRARQLLVVGNPEERRDLLAALARHGREHG